MEQNDIGALQSQIENLKKSQSGSDRTVTELRQALQEKEQQYQELENKFTGKGQEEASRHKREVEDFERKKDALALAVERGIDPEKAFNLLGLNQDLSDADRLDLFKDSQDQARFEERDRFARTHGVKPHVSVSLGHALTWDEIQTLPDAEIKNIPESILLNAKKVKEKQGKQTLRQRIGGTK